MPKVRSILALVLLGGCAPIIATLPITQFSNDPVMLPGDSAATSTLKAAEQAVRAEFAQRGVRVLPQAALRAEVTLSQRRTMVGYAAVGQEDAVDAKPQDGRIDLCRDHVFRLTVAVYDERSARVVYRGAGERRRCGELTADNMAELAEVALGGLL